MKPLFKLCVIVLALFLELIVLEIGIEMIFGRSHGPMVDTRFRRKERLAAYDARYRNPSPETDAAFREEMRLMRQHPNPEIAVFWFLFVVGNGTAIHFYLRRKSLNPTAQQNITTDRKRLPCKS